MSDTKVRLHKYVKSMHKIKFWRFVTRIPGAGVIFVQNSGNLFSLDFPAGLCYKKDNFILLKAVRRTNGVRHSVFRESRRGTNSAWCKRPGRRPHLYHRRVWGRTPAGYGPLQPPRVALTFCNRRAQIGWNRGVLQCFIPGNSKG